MSFFEDIIQKIFPTEPSRSNSFKEVLQRTERYERAYRKWLLSSKKDTILHAISKAYFYKKTNITSRIQVHLFQSNGANGFAISYDPFFGPASFRFLLDYFKEKVQKLSYKIQSSEKQILDKKYYIEEKEIYYLKPFSPSKNKTSSLTNQRYGNVLLEHITIDGRPGYLKVLVTFYADYQFTPVQDYDDFIENLFDKES